MTWAAMSKLSTLQQTIHFAVCDRRGETNCFHSDSVDTLLSNCERETTDSMCNANAQSWSEDVERLKTHVLIALQYPIFKRVGNSALTFENIVNSILHNEKVDTFHDVGGDGDCLFHTLGYVLEQLNVNVTPSNLRQQVVAYVMLYYKQNETLLGHVMNEYVDLTEDLNVVTNNRLDEQQAKLWRDAMRQPGTWAGPACILAFAHMYDVNIQTISYPDDFMVRQYTVNLDPDYLIIRYIQNQHFQVLVDAHKNLIGVITDIKRHTIKNIRFDFTL